MSVDDRDKWNARYAAGAYAERTRPSALLVDTLARYPLAGGARALDVACGAGRNAIYDPYRFAFFVDRDTADPVIQTGR